ncbi:DUF2752 domain-containing protein [Planosporangium thailandense]|uniref:DUF2752 domain-containing protein n=1 Tax=Planosporangium thailandense TaxID=765197 RepID=A0ABX0XQQ2_9ACTN|nr:DUF2752 domain-containing protein [Planosporangium thailandense]NJC68263.1 DUF2752 domain-containing protein [Planosporangium thailandense]
MSPTTEHVESCPPGPAYTLPPPGRVSRLVVKVAARSPAWAAPAAIATCFAGAVGYVLVNNPTTPGAYASPTCLLKLTTGFDCPGCGGTRAFWYLLHGNLPQAARNHALFVFAVPFLLYVYIAWSAKLIFKRDVLPALRIPPLTLPVFLGAWLVFSVLRNLPFAPFTWFYV